MNTEVNNYIFNKFVAMPPDFDVKSHLHMREQIGMFKVKDINIPTLEIICSSIRVSPVFSTMNNAKLKPENCFFLLNLFNELNLVIKSIDNPFRREMNDKIYMNFCEEWHRQRVHYIRGQFVNTISFTFINLYHLYNDNIYAEVASNVENIQKYQNEINQSITV